MTMYRIDEGLHTHTHTHTHTHILYEYYLLIEEVFFYYERNEYFLIFFKCHWTCFEVHRENYIVFLLNAFNWNDRYIYFLINLFILRERERKSMDERQRSERENPKQGSILWTVSSWPEPRQRAGSSTNWATQAPL